MTHYISSKISKLLFVSLIILFISSCSNNDIEEIINLPELPLDEIELMNVSYGDDSKQKYDIYLPKDRTSSVTKVFVLIHGGAWIGGDKNDMNYLTDLLKIQFPDYAIVNINYRLASLATSAFPMQIDDIESVISDLKSKSQEYQISDAYGFIGTSAGAHLSMLYTYSFDNSNDVEMVCSIVGPTNFTDTNYVDNPDYEEQMASIQLIMGVEYSINPQFYEDLSPYHIVSASAPPTILFYGGQDDLIPTSQGIEMHEKLDAIGVINEFTLYENEGHGWDGVNALDTMTKLSNFISSYF